MGNDCTHERRENIGIVSTHHTFLTTTIIHKMKCLDCLDRRGEPTTFLVKSSMERLTKITYHSSIFNPAECTHDYFTVDKSTIQTCSETWLPDIFSDWGFGVNHFKKAKAICDDCGFCFVVRANFETKQQNYKRVEIIGKWSPVKTTKITETTVENRSKVFVPYQ